MMKKEKGEKDEIVKIEFQMMPRCCVCCDEAEIELQIVIDPRLAQCETGKTTFFSPLSAPFPIAFHSRFKGGLKTLTNEKSISKTSKSILH